MSVGVHPAASSAQVSRRSTDLPSCPSRGNNRSVGLWVAPTSGLERRGLRRSCDWRDGFGIRNRPDAGFGGADVASCLARISIRQLRNNVRQPWGGTSDDWWKFAGLHGLCPRRAAPGIPVSFRKRSGCFRIPLWPNPMATTVWLCETDRESAQEIYRRANGSGTACAVGSGGTVETGVFPSTEPVLAEPQISDCSISRIR